MSSLIVFSMFDWTCQWNLILLNQCFVHTLEHCLKFNRCWQTIKAWDHLLSFSDRWWWSFMAAFLSIHRVSLWSDKAILKMVCFNKLTHSEESLLAPFACPLFMLCTTCTASKTHHDKQAAYIILQLIWLTAIWTVFLYICNEFFVSQGGGAATLIHLTQRDPFLPLMN